MVMIKDLLERTNKRLRLASCFNEEKGHPNLPPNLLDISVENYQEDIELIRVARDIGQPAYFLPWGADSGYYIDLPDNLPDRQLFLTAELSGCYIGVQKVNAVTRVRHYNFVDPIVDVSDFERYDGETQTKWLVPIKDNNQFLFNNSNIPHEFYSNYFPIPVVFWGEFRGGKWNFYYQTQDKEVHLFDITQIHPI